MPPPHAHPHAHVSLITLGVADVARSARFYGELGFTRKVRAADDGVAFFEAGGVVLSLFGWDALAKDADIPSAPQRSGYRGIAVAWNCPSERDVDAVIGAAVKAGGACLKPAQKAFWGGYHGYFTDPDGHVWEVAHNPHFAISADGRIALPD
jgi:predicted lactoylglutathione lyase